MLALKSHAFLLCLLDILETCQKAEYPLYFPTFSQPTSYRATWVSLRVFLPVDIASLFWYSLQWYSKHWHTLSAVSPLKDES